MDGVVHEDVFVEFLPTQGATLDAERGFFQKLLRGVGEAPFMIHHRRSGGGARLREPGGAGSLRA